ncbi:Os02g0281150 [Oryza sativa Japonica Group]|uniref:Os02g0281150 protein n=1 Tax=Oryza sativa subsp. japonica TaxID=39947 RepID=C7IYH4_ORYSJ|nr:Os02g0281150 [Oryza sativa Japonica Group]|eukprot:NP_001172897.1 Os02g0281150 [Oryza sativa Japonica Group]
MAATAAAEAEAAAGDEAWCRETVPRVMELVSPRLPQRDACALLAVSPWCHRALVANPKLWEVRYRVASLPSTFFVLPLLALGLDSRGVLLRCFALLRKWSLAWASSLEWPPRYCHLKIINLEFAQDIDDRHFVRLKEMGCTSLQELELLNINACQKVSDKGIETITSLCPNLRALSIYWIVGLTDLTIRHIVQNCKHIVDLNLSGCKNISDKGMQLVADNYEGLKKLNITRCIKLTDDGLQEVLQKCSSLESLNLYALSRCVRVTDVGVVAIAQGCRSLQLLSLFGIVGVTDVCLEALSKHCSRSLTTLDVNGCIGIKWWEVDLFVSGPDALECVYPAVFEFLGFYNIFRGSIQELAHLLRNNISFA